MYAEATTLSVPAQGRWMAEGPDRDGWQGTRTSKREQTQQRKRQKHPKRQCTNKSHHRFESRVNSTNQAKSKARYGNPGRSQSKQSAALRKSSVLSNPLLSTTKTKQDLLGQHDDVAGGAHNCIIVPFSLVVKRAMRSSTCFCTSVSIVRMLSRPT